MAKQNGVAPSLDLRPPPSTMLETHVVNRRGGLNISDQDFAELLRESLGHNDDGESNLSKDVSTNKMLLCVIMSIGLIPIAEAKPDDPFARQLKHSKFVTQLKDCLDVINVILERSPAVLFQEAIIHRKGVAVPTEAHTDHTPIYLWLISGLLPIAVRSSDSTLVERCRKILHACLSFEYRCAYGACSTINELLRDVLCVLSTTARSAVVDRPVDQTDPLSSLPPYCRYLTQNLNLGNADECITVGVLLAESLLSQNVSRPLTLQIKKHVKRFESAVQYLPASKTTETQLKTVQSQIAGISLSFSTSSRPKSAMIENNDLDDGRARKRQRLSADNTRSHGPDSVISSLARDLTRILTGQAVSDFDNLAVTSVQYFKQATEQDKRKAILALGNTACHLSMHTTMKADCDICDHGRDRNSSTRHPFEVDKLLATLDALQPQAERTLAIRNATLESYRRLLNHISGTHRLTLTKSQAGKFCLQSLRSSDRDCRLRAANLLRTLIQAPSDHAELEASCRNDRIAAFEYLAKC